MSSKRSVGDLVLISFWKGGFRLNSQEVRPFSYPSLLTRQSARTIGDLSRGKAQANEREGELAVLRGSGATKTQECCRLAKTVSPPGSLRRLRHIVEFLSRSGEHSLNPGDSFLRSRSEINRW